jgi:hypothetical protein
MQDHFRDTDIMEYRRMKRDLGSLAKTCRNLQLKLKRTQMLRQKEKLRKEKALAEGELSALVEPAAAGQGMSGQEPSDKSGSEESNSRSDEDVESSKDLWKSAAIW